MVKLRENRQNPYCKNYHTFVKFGKMQILKEQKHAFAYIEKVLISK